MRQNITLKKRKLIDLPANVEVAIRMMAAMKEMSVKTFIESLIKEKASEYEDFLLGELANTPEANTPVNESEKSEINKLLFEKNEN